MLNFQILLRHGIASWTRFFTIARKNDGKEAPRLSWLCVGVFVRSRIKCAISRQCAAYPALQVESVVLAIQGPPRHAPRR